MPPPGQKRTISGAFPSAVRVTLHRARLRISPASPLELLCRSRRLRHPRLDHGRPLRIWARSDLSPLDGGRWSRHMSVSVRD